MAINPSYDKLQKLIDEADTLMASGKYDEAEPLMLVVLKYDKQNVEALYYLGEIYCKQGQFEQSVHILRMAYKLAQHNWQIVELLGWALCMNHQLDEARVYMEKAYTIHPTDIRLLCDFAVVEMNANDFTAASKYLQEAIAIAPDDEMVLDVKQAFESMSVAMEKHSTSEKLIN